MSDLSVSGSVLFVCFFLRIRRPPRSTRTDTLFPYTTLFRSGGAGRCRAFLEGRVERDLRILLVEQILRPQLERPALVGAAHADARVDDRIAVQIGRAHV